MEGEWWCWRFVGGDGGDVGVVDGVGVDVQVVLEVVMLGLEIVLV